MTFDKGRISEGHLTGADTHRRLQAESDQRDQLLREVDAMDDVEPRDTTDRIRLDAGHVILAYAEVFGCTAEEARDQVRDADRLEAAVARPRTYHMYQGADLALEAAVLAHRIAEGQVFVEGNKRTAYVAMRTFLLMNGHDLDASQDDRFRWMVGLSQGLTPERLAEELRGSMRPVNDPERG